MLSQLLYPNLSFLPRFLVDLFTGFLIVYALRLALIAFNRSRLLRNATTGPIVYLSNLPGPKSPSWLWGSEWEMYNTSPGQKYMEWYHTFGRIFKFKGALGSSFVTLADPSAIHHILSPQHCYEFPKPEGERQFFYTLLGKGMIWAEGLTHSRQRKILGPAFSSGALASLSTIFFDSSYKVVRAWNTLFEQSSSDSLTIDVQRWANHISLDTIGLAGFSYDFGTLDPNRPQHPLARTLDGFTDSSGTHSFSAFLVHSLIWAFPAILRIPSNRQKALSKSRNMLAEITNKVWAERKALSNPQGSGKSILELLLKAEKPGSASNLTKEQIAAEMMTLIFAGYETTATIIAWALYELATHPEIQEELRRQVTDISLSDPSFEDLHNGLPLLSAVVNETLRFHPTFMQIHREASKDSLLPLTPLPQEFTQTGITPTTGTHLFVPKGTILILPINIMQSSEDVWGPDAHIWNPYRWMDIGATGKEANESKQTQWRKDLLIFSTGARGCIGHNFAKLEIKTVLATLLRNFAFAPADNNEIEPLLSFVVRPKVKGEHRSSLPLKITRLNY
ncbi:hypothetical protein Clacol_002721 [Clathrus columnatus]|uniref:Cytochrome P450 n=1 Tax=Clathrus columnatus TaxID=1419009 RepID=A0AAV5A785_9AGAM|nr:hypothetical protein Clacol_002721 [Clathrus columnatus]